LSVIFINLLLIVVDHRNDGLSLLSKSIGDLRLGFFLKFIDLKLFRLKINFLHQDMFFSFSSLLFDSGSINFLFSSLLSF
jgi:hypothetical protein